MAQKVINYTWYANRSSNLGKESLRIVEAAAKLIKESIRECQYDNEFYPLKSAIQSRTLAKEWLPPLL